MNVNYNQQTLSIYDQIKPICAGIIVFLVFNFIGFILSTITYAVVRPLNAPEDVQMLSSNIQRVCELAHILLMIAAGLIFAAFSAKKFPEHINYLKTEKRSIYGQIFICVVIIIMFFYGELENDYVFEFLNITADYENPGFISYVLPITFEAVFTWRYLSIYGIIMYIPYVLAMRLRYMKR